MLTEKRKADREELARRVEALCTEYGAKCERSGFHDAREIMLYIVCENVRVHVNFDGDNPRSLLDNYCLPWCVERCDARLSAAFGLAQGAEVNPFHRRKCTAFAYGIDNLLRQLAAGFELLKSGRAFECETAR